MPWEPFPVTFEGHIRAKSFFEVSFRTIFWLPASITTEMAGVTGITANVVHCGTSRTIPSQLAPQHIHHQLGLIRFVEVSEEAFEGELLRDIVLHMAN